MQGLDVFILMELGDNKCTTYGTADDKVAGNQFRNI